MEGLRLRPGGQEEMVIQDTAGIKVFFYEGVSWIIKEWKSNENPEQKSSRQDIEGKCIVKDQETMEFLVKIGDRR